MTKPDSPPGQDDKPGQGTDTAPGQNKPEAEQDLPADQPEVDNEVPEPEAEPKG